jgi:hypothetical protein
MAQGTINAVNGHSPDLFLRVADQNTAQPTVVLDNARVDSGTSLPVSVEINGQGESVVRWISWLPNDPIPAPGAEQNNDDVPTAAGGDLSVYSP